MNTYSAVSSVIQKVGELKKKDDTIRNDINRIILNVNKCQIETWPHFYDDLNSKFKEEDQIDHGEGGSDSGNEGFNDWGGFTTWC